jgi:sporulation protein YlmC with PRC-barrel domain
VLLHLGTSVACRDGALGELADLVIHPDTRRVTHLVVAPHHRHDEARLVPFELVTAGPASKEIHLDSTTAQAHALPEAQQYAYVRIDEGPLPADDPGAVGIADVINVPMDDYGSTFAAGPISYDDHISVIYDRIPRGEVEARHASHVVGSDGERIGRLDGLVVDEQGTITQLVLERGHLWGRRRVTIPADAVARFDMDGVTLAISKSQVSKILPVASDE